MLSTILAHAGPGALWKSLHKNVWTDICLFMWFYGQLSTYELGRTQKHSVSKKK